MFVKFWKYCKYNFNFSLGVIYCSIRTFPKPFSYCYIWGMSTSVINWIWEILVYIPHMKQKRMELGPNHFSISTWCWNCTPVKMSQARFYPILQGLTALQFDDVSQEFKNFCKQKWNFNIQIVVQWSTTTRYICKEKQIVFKNLLYWLFFKCHRSK